MKKEDVLTNAPSDNYLPSMYMTWFRGKASPLHDEVDILCQKWISDNEGEKDAWVAIETKDVT